MSYTLSLGSLIARSLVGRNKRNSAGTDGTDGPKGAAEAPEGVPSTPKGVSPTPKGVSPTPYAAPADDRAGGRDGGGDRGWEDTGELLPAAAAAAPLVMLIGRRGPVLLCLGVLSGVCAHIHSRPDPSPPLTLSKTFLI